MGIIESKKNTPLFLSGMNTGVSHGGRDDFEDIDFVKVDVEKFPQIANPFFITDFPAVFALADGLILDRIDQVNTASEIEKKLNQLNRFIAQATGKKTKL